MRYLHLIRLVLFALLVSAPTAAQNRSTGEILGTVHDASGSLVAGATVVVVNADTKVRNSTGTDSLGSYVFPYLPPGPYSVAFEQPGFKRLVREGITLQVDQAARVDVTMEVGGITETINVTSNAPLVDTDRSERYTTLTAKAVEQLPVLGRNLWSFIQIAPSISSTQGRLYTNTDSKLNVNGSRDGAISSTLDGGTTFAPQSTDYAGSLPALDAVEQMDVITDNFSAEFGTGAAVVSVITKSGTNQFHGSAFEDFQNDVLNARNFFARSKPVLRYNQFGYSIGGPIRRNQTFFFFAYQGLRSKNPAIAISSVPNGLVRQGNFAGLPTIYDQATTQIVNGAAMRTAFPGNLIPANRIDPVSAKLLAYWPAPNQPGNANNYYSVGGQTFDRGIYNLKIDHNFSSTHRITGTFELNYETFNYLDPFPGAGCYPGNGFCGPLIQRNYPATLSDTWTARSNLVNQFRMAFLRNATEATPPSIGQSIPEQIGLNVPPPDSFPFISIAGAIPTTMGSGIELNLYQSVFEPSDILSWVKGRHSLKMGGALQKVRSNISQGLDSGIFSFTGLFSGQPPASGIGFADFLLGLPQVYQLNKPLHLGARRWSFNSFVQDNFKLSSTLTLEFGLRYQLEAMFHEVHGRESNFDPAAENPATGTRGAIIFPGAAGLQNTHNLFAPRFGVAWTPLSRTTIRSAYGIFFIPPSGGTNSNSTPAGFNLSQTIQTTDQLTPQFQLVKGPPPVAYLTSAQRTASILNGQSIAWYPQAAPFGYYQQWHFTIQRQFPGDMVLETAYVGTKGTHLLFPRDFNQVPPALLGPGNAQLRRPYPQYQTITAYLMDANSNYQSVQFSLRKNFSHGLTFLANYVVSKSIDNSSSEMQTAGVTNGNEWQIASSPDLNRAISQFDLPQRLVVTAVYELPFGAGRALMNRRGVLDAFFGGWRASTIFTAQSGIPFTVFAGGANLSGALTGNWYPNRQGNGSLPPGQRSIYRWFDASEFANPAAFRFGNSGRDILRGPGYWNDDFSLAKDFVPVERFRINLRADFSNVLNHPDFGQPAATLGSAATGTINSATAARAIQLSLRVLF